MAGPPPTIRQVAERAQTSIATVSKVLNRKPGSMRPELRSRVLKAAGDLGYVQNAAARSLKGLTRGIIAVLVPQFGNNFFTRICVEVEAVARAFGYVVTICNSDEDPEQEREILERLISQQIDGCILSPALSQADNVALLRRHGVPTVILERPVGEAVPSSDFVGHDNFQSGHLAARTLLEAGHRRIAFAGWNSPIPNIHDRARGYAAALRESGTEPETQWLLLDDLDEEGGRALAARVARIDVTGLVIAHHHELAKGLLLGLADRGLRWPDDLSIVLIGTPEWRDLVRPSLACVERPEREMGRRAAALLLGKIAAPGTDNRAEILDNSFIAGGSVRPLGVARDLEAVQ